MRLAAPLLVLTPVSMGAAGKTATLQIRGRAHSIAILSSPAPSKGAILFLPGDGGWRGLAVSVAQAMCAWGYDIYGFDTRSYLESGADISVSEMQRDLTDVIAWICSRGPKRVTLLGWSHGAGMAVLAAQQWAGVPVNGVITLGLPEAAVLAWNWTGTIASLVRRDPGQPAFGMTALLPNVAPAPLWMIHGDADEYTTPATAERLYRAAAEPKRLISIRRANHRFDGARGELFHALQQGLEWVRVAGR
jgi:pimeloyl-ACP methyl ester carboxylesterase